MLSLDPSIFIIPSKQELDEIQKRIDYNFTDTKLLLAALTHPSIRNYNKLYVNYERMEFLGDSIITMAISELLFNKFKNYDEGRLSKLRNMLICKNTFYQIALEIKLSLIMSNKELNKFHGSKRKNALEDALEALMAAIYLDSNFLSVKKVIENLWDKHLQNNINNTSDPKSLLQNWAQSRGFDLPCYNIVKTTGKDHEPEFTVEVIVETLGKCYGKGSTRKIAEKHAAIEMLKANNITLK